ncbi:MAG: hypothetical protein K6F57_04850 [Candidatus Saccharibacteria bacterium]|nr:hypothetical protein [Candidatus Saccharibacteria bacterium]
MEEKKKSSKRVRYLSKTPNIKNSSDKSFNSSSSDSSTSQATNNEVSTEKNKLSFNSQDIKQKDDSKLFVNVEGADRIAREKERAAKKKDDELIKRLQTAADKRKRENRAAKREASKQARNNQFKKIWAQIVRFRILVMAVLILAVLIPSAFVIYRNIHEVVEQQIIASKRAAENKLFEDNYTDMLKIYTQLAGTEKTKEEVNTIIDAFGGDIAVQYYELEEGVILHEEGRYDFIRFDIRTDKKQVIIYNFRYFDVINKERVSIYGDGKNYHFIYNNIDQEYDNVGELIKDYVLEKNKQS